MTNSKCTKETSEISLTARKGWWPCFQPSLRTGSMASRALRCGICGTLHQTGLRIVGCCTCDELCSGHVRFVCCGNAGWEGITDDVWLSLWGCWYWNGVRNLEMLLYGLVWCNEYSDCFKYGAQGSSRDVSTNKNITRQFMLDDCTECCERWYV